MPKNHGPNRVPQQLPKKRRLGSSQIKPGSGGKKFGAQCEPPTRANKKRRLGFVQTVETVKKHPRKPVMGQPADSIGYSQNHGQKPPGHGGSD